MSALRDKAWKRFGAGLAGLALYVQLAFAGWGVLALATPADPGDALAGHALCLAQGGSPSPATPAPTAPTHNHAACCCCLWHQAPAIEPLAAATPRPVIDIRLVRREADGESFVPAPSRGPANARAPPAAA
ncbi:MAG TPA: hypothetical protein VMB84_02545 [Stellaceae bacterium]|nr:hypothetical protein [Stellaceae bacterium]